MQSTDFNYETMKVENKNHNFRKIYSINNKYIFGSFGTSIDVNKILEFAKNYENLSEFKMNLMDTLENEFKSYPAGLRQRSYFFTGYNNHWEKYTFSRISYQDNFLHNMTNAPKQDEFKIIIPDYQEMDDSNSIRNIAPNYINIEHINAINKEFISGSISIFDLLSTIKEEFSNAIMKISEHPSLGEFINNKIDYCYSALETKNKPIFKGDADDRIANGR